MRNRKKIDLPTEVELKSKFLKSVDRKRNRNQFFVFEIYEFGSNSRMGLLKSEFQISKSEIEYLIQLQICMFFMYVYVI